MDEQKALEIFSQSDADAARHAWGHLCEINRERLRRYVSAWTDVDQQHDIVQDAFLKLWDYRERFKNQGVAAWHGFLYRTAYHCSVDLARRSQFQVELPDPDDIPDSDLSALGNVVDGVIAAVDDRQLDHCANVLWLGLDPSLSEATHDRQLIAVQLYYLDGESWQQVLQLLAPGPADERTLTREHSTPGCPIPASCGISPMGDLFLERATGGISPGAERRRDILHTRLVYARGVPSSTRYGATGLLLALGIRASRHSSTA
jgi:DNA-directed RNA polymerase specialized sigma24 family protein